MKKRPRMNIRAAAGMMLAGECRFYFWFGWLAWMLAIAGIAFGEYVWRVPDPPAAYLVEAVVMMTSWLSALFLADSRVVSIYRRTWQQLRQRFMAPVVIEPQVVDQIRKELAVDPLLKWFKPPRSSGLRAQLLTAALWWQAVTAPEGTPRLKRYGEWFVDALLGYLPLGLAVAVLIVWPVWRGLGTAALLGSIGMAVLGYSAIRLAARRQALLDYFSTWREDLRDS
jgi:hypothetical protein